MSETKGGGWLKAIAGAIGGGVLTAVFTLGTQHQLQTDNMRLQNDLEVAKAALQKQVEAEKVKLEEQRDQQQHLLKSQEIASDHLYEHRKAVLQQESQLSGQYWTVIFKNSCNERVSIALNFKALDNQWSTSGWWSAESGESRETAAQTRNTVVYYYATSKNHTWQGKPGTDSVEEDISRESFDHLEGEPFVGSVSSRVLFQKYTFHQSEWSKPAIELTCSEP